MKTIRYYLATFALAIVLLAGNAMALNVADVGKFVGGLDAFDAFSKGMEGANGDVFDTMDLMPKAGEVFQPFTTSTELLKENYSSYYSQFEGVVEGMGFGSVSEWASVADQVILAYVASTMNVDAGQSVEALKSMTPEMRAMMPESVQQQMDASVRVMEAVDNVPTANIEAVKPYLDQLTAWMERQK